MIKKAYLIFLILIIIQISCNKEFDYDDYESRVEYFENIRNPEYAPSDTLTVITWNILMAFGFEQNPWSNDIGGQPDHIDSISQFLNNQNADIILLQEIPYNRENTVVKKVLDRIGANLNFNYAFGAHGFNSNGTYPTRAQWGNAILSKFQIKSIENREVHNLNDIWTRRSILKVELEFKAGKHLNAYSLHLNPIVNSNEDFYDQIRKANGFHLESSNPTIMGGDFNVSKTVVSPILELEDCTPENFDSGDLIYVSSDLYRIIEYLTEIPGSTSYSDHFASYVRLKIIE